MGSRIKQLQEDIVGLLNTCSYFDDITVIAEDRADFPSLIARALSNIASKGNKTGIAVVVEEPDASANTRIPSPYLTSVKQKIIILESIGINRTSPYGTLKKGYEVAEIILSCLWEVFVDGNPNNPIWTGEPAIRCIGALPENPGIMVIELALEAHIPLLQVARVENPSVNIAANTATISCPNASIFYSLDGSFPNLTYSTPVANVTAGTQVRAIGTKDTYATSNIVEVIA